MREILFRGKHTDSGEWKYGDLIHAKRRSETVCWIMESSNRNEWRQISYFVAPDTVGQYTGLTDKNGVRIFEGDIVKCRSGRICKVVYFVKTNISTFDLDPIAGFDCPPPEKWDLWSNAEVVGNVHDNPELLTA